MKITEPIMRRFYEQLCQPILKQLEDPVASQEECLFNILSRNKDSAFGKDHHFSDIKTLKEYQQNVPITEYTYMQPYVNRTIQGEQNILFPDPILYFLVTSGTTGNPKLYPFGKYRIQESIFNFVASALFYIVHRNRFDITEGKRLMFPAPAMTGQKIGNYDVAFISGALTVVPLPPEFQIYQMRSYRIPPDEVNNEIDWNKKFYLTARYAVSEDVRSAVGVTSNVVSLLNKISTEFLDRLLSDPEINQETKKKLHAAAEGDILNLRKLWPKFTVVYSSGVSLTPFKRIINELLGEVDIWEAYIATEATLGTQIYQDKGIIPFINHVFFEFIPEDHDDADAIPLSDVRLHTPYRVIITTAGGFYRYDIGDLVEFIGLDPPELQVIGRKTSLVSLAGERMSEELFLRTLERACKKRDIGFVDFALLPEITQNILRYILYVEFTQPPDDLDEFTNFVDERLGLANITYAAQRQANVLSKPVIIPVQPGGFEVMLKRQKKVLGQTKVSRRLTAETSRLIPRLNKD